MLYIGEKVGGGNELAHRYRARSARRHDAVRQGDAQCDRLRRDGGRRQPAACARHLYGQDRDRRRISGRRRRSRSAARKRTSRASPRRRACRRREITACILDRPRHETLIAGGARDRRLGQAHHRRRRGGRHPYRATRKKPASTSIWALAARRRACSRRRRCAASAGRCRAGSSPRARSRRRGPARWASTDFNKKFTLDDMASGRCDVRGDRRHRRLAAARACGSTRSM